MVFGRLDVSDTFSVYDWFIYIKVRVICIC